MALLATRLIDTMRATPRRSKEGSEPLRNTALYDQGCEKLFQWLISGDDVNPPEGKVPAFARPLFREKDILTLQNVHRSISEIDCVYHAYSGTLRRCWLSSNCDLVGKPEVIGRHYPRKPFQIPQPWICVLTIMHRLSF